jgi:hypothetical protein
MLPHRSSCVAVISGGIQADSRDEYICYSYMIRLSTVVEAEREGWSIVLYSSDSLQHTSESCSDRTVVGRVSGALNRSCLIQVKGRVWR